MLALPSPPQEWRQFPLEPYQTAQTLFLRATYWNREAALYRSSNNRRCELYLDEANRLYKLSRERAFRETPGTALARKRRTG
jgi:hypothetical protein